MANKAREPQPKCQKKAIFQFCRQCLSALNDKTVSLPNITRSILHQLMDGERNEKLCELYSNIATLSAQQITPCTNKKILRQLRCLQQVFSQLSQKNMSLNEREKLLAAIEQYFDSESVAVLTKQPTVLLGTPLTSSAPQPSL